MPQDGSKNGTITSSIMKLPQKKQQQPARRSGLSSTRQTRATDEGLSERYAFRRNRTLTGSLASGVSSATEHRAELKSSRIHAHDLRHHRRRLSVVLLSVLAIGGILALLVYQSVAVVHVTAATDTPIDASLYEQEVQDYLANRPIERSRLTLDTAKLTRHLQANGCPEVQSVAPRMSFDGIGATQLTFVLRRPAVMWRTGDTRLYVDDTGVAFTRNYYTEPTVNIVDQSGIATQDNKVLASNRLLSFIGMVIGRMNANGYSVTRVALPAGTTRQIAVSVTSVSYPVKFSVDRPVGEQAEDAVRALQYLTTKGVTPEYIDVRVSGKAYYK